jgi:hypothetical protein
MISLQVDGLEDIRRALAEFSDRRFESTVATALTKTAKEMSKDWQDHINAKIDRPTARTKSATAFLSANAQTLTARVLVKDQGSGSPAEYLGPQERGGGRTIKRFEQALISGGAMPRGYVTVPGRTAQRDGYGNISRSLIIAVIADLGAQFSPGYQRVISKRAEKRLATRVKRGLTYVAVSPEAARERGISPGIYEMNSSKALKAVFIFVRAVTYRRQLDLLGKATSADAVQRRMQMELDIAIGKSWRRLKGLA